MNIAENLYRTPSGRVTLDSANGANTPVLVCGATISTAEAATLGVTPELARGIEPQAESSAPAETPAPAEPASPAEPATTPRAAAKRAAKKPAA